MFRLKSRLGAVLAAGIMTFSSYSAQAMPMMAAPQMSGDSMVTQVDHHRRPPPRHHGRPSHGRPDHGGHHRPPHYGGHHRPPHHGSYNHGHHGGGYYNGHRGYRDHRPGYRYYNGYWFPLAAFGAGAIIGGAASSSSSYSNHVAWCESRYRTYRSSDNTYVASAGVRRTCVSPYR